MSDDEADPELLELLRESLGLRKKKASDEISSDTGVLKDAEHIYANAIDVSIDMWGTKGAAALIYKTMQERSYSTEMWSRHEMHPTREEGFSDVDIVNFVFTLDLLNFSFWSELPEDERFQVDYLGKRWTGYKSLLACLRRALDEDIPITSPSFWYDQKTSHETLKDIFRSATEEPMPLLDKRIAMLRDAGMELTESFGDPRPHSSSNMEIESSDGREAERFSRDERSIPIKVEEPPTEGLSSLQIREEGSAAAAEAAAAADAGEEEETKQSADAPEKSSPTENLISSTEQEPPREPDQSIVRLIEKANGSAGKLVNLLAKHFPSFRDEGRFDGRKVRFMKRAQIFVADLWAAMNGTGYGAFEDIDHLTMFADYRVPQMLHSLGVLVYSPPLANAVRTQQELPSGHSWEIQLRGCTIWAVELIRREMLRHDPSATNVNAVLIDFFLYDLAKEREAAEDAHPEGRRDLSSL